MRPARIGERLQGNDSLAHDPQTGLNGIDAGRRQRGELAETVANQQARLRARLHQDLRGQDRAQINADLIQIRAILEPVVALLLRSRGDEREKFRSEKTPAICSVSSSPPGRYHW